MTGLDSASAVCLGSSTSKRHSDVDRTQHGIPVIVEPLCQNWCNLVALDRHGRVHDVSSCTSVKPSSPRVIV